MFIGVIINTVTVLLGSLLGLLAKKGIPDKLSKAVMTAIGLCTIYIGFDGALKGDNTIILIVSMVFGTLLGSLIDLDQKIERVGKWIEKKVKKKDDGSASIAEGFMSATLLFCVGTMTIVGGINAGLNGDNELYFTKATLDFISAIMLTSSLGIGVIFAAVSVLVIQGGIVILASLMQNMLTDTLMISEVVCCGSVIIIGLGLNLIGVTKIKVANMLPAVFLVPLFYFLWGLLPL